MELPGHWSGPTSPLVGDDSGGIMGLLSTLCRRLAARPLFGLGFAPPEILPQRRREPPLLLGLLQCLRTQCLRIIVHAGRLRPADTARKTSRDRPANARLRLHPVPPCGKDRGVCGRNRSLISSGRTARCRSSVVEHPLGKGEVVSSILTGSTSNSFRVQVGVLPQSQWLIIATGKLLILFGAFCFGTACDDKRNLYRLISLYFSPTHESAS